jgi:hypothetical protein
MSNIAGKSYAMNVITPVSRWWVWWNLLIFWLVKTPFMAKRLNGLRTLSLIHYARWVVLRPHQFPHLSDDQPKERLKYSYMLFFSNFNGSWTQYVDSFHMAIPGGLNLIWNKNIRYPKSVPLQPFHRYIVFNQIWTDHYYNAYPLASSNDIKSAMALRSALLEFSGSIEKLSDAEFYKAYKRFLFENQAYLGKMASSPVVSLADEAENETRRLNELYGRLDSQSGG